MTDAAHLDFETRSTVDLKKAGAYRYAEHSTTEPICFSWSVPSGEAGEWRIGEPLPAPLVLHVLEDGKVTAHNASFERAIWNRCLRRLFPEIPELRIEQQDCTMARALAIGLPADLDRLGAALDMPVQKDKEGHALMLRMCRPRSVCACEACNGDGCDLCGGTGSVINWWDDEERMSKLIAYCATDREVETAIDEAIPVLDPNERKVWELDQRINERGVKVDVAACQSALAVVEEAQKAAHRKMLRLTEGAVLKCSEVTKLTAWLEKRGYPCKKGIGKGALKEMIIKASTLGDDTAVEVMKLRLATAKSSTAKLKSALNSVCADGRLRGMLAYHGAATGRWAGRLFQPQNIKRLDGDRLPDVKRTFEILSMPLSTREREAAIEMTIGPSLESISNCLRAMLQAEPGMKFVSGDFSNIEGRGAAWLTDEKWKIDAFRAFDRGEGHDLYKLSYSRSFGVPIEETGKAERQIGKVQELALGYQGSVGAYINMGANYGIKPAEVAEVARRAVSGDVWIETSSGYERATNQYELDRDTWTGIKCVVNAWRAAHPNIVQAWWDLQDAALQAVQAPGLKVPVLNGRIIYLAKNGFLYCRLPSGRVISYAKPRVVLDEEFNQHQVAFWGIESYSRQWKEQRLYGGLQFNNCVQGLARDKLVSSMFRLEEAGYPIVLTVHDENVSEVPEDFGSWHEYRDIMAMPDAWCADMPVAVGAWEDTRYVK